MFAINAKYADQVLIRSPIWGNSPAECSKDNKVSLTRQNMKVLPNQMILILSTLSFIYMVYKGRTISPEHHGERHLSVQTGVSVQAAVELLLSSRQCGTRHIMHPLSTHAIKGESL